MRIGACIITYNPDISVLITGIESLISQVDKLIVTDNGSKEKDTLQDICAKYDKVQFIPLGENKGIAAATNIALQEFAELKYDFVLTSDQDSVYPADYVIKFKNNKELLNDDNIAVYTPVFFDENGADYAPVIVESRFFVKKTRAVDKFTDVFQAIASGMIINLNLLQTIGMMDEDLFIDWIDLEFCWRVHFYQKRIVCCKDMTIHHKLGDKSVDIGYRKVSLRSWIRNYYITRNAFYLATHTRYLKKISKVILFIKSFRYIAGFTILCENHKKNFSYTVKGMHDGIHGRLGKLNE